MTVSISIAIPTLVAVVMTCGAVGGALDSTPSPPPAGEFEKVVAGAFADKGLPGYVRLSNVVRAECLGVSVTDRGPCPDLYVADYLSRSDSNIVRVAVQLVKPESRILFWRNLGSGAATASQSLAFLDSDSVRARLSLLGYAPVTHLRFMHCAAGPESAATIDCLNYGAFFWKFRTSDGKALLYLGTFRVLAFPGDF